MSERLQAEQSDLCEHSKHRKCVLAIDLGTTSVRAAVVNQDLQVVCSAQQRLTLTRLAEGAVQQDGADILTATNAVIAAVLTQYSTIMRDSGYPQQRLVCALATQRSTVIAWQATTGAPASAALSWQDTRGCVAVQAMASHRKCIQTLSGLVLSPHYGATKIHWLAEHLAVEYPRVSAGEPSCLRIAPLASFILFNVLQHQPFVCDECNAGRTQLMDIQQRCWSLELAQLFRVDPATLPRIKPVMAAYGRLKHHNDVAMVAVCGDQNAAFYAVKCLATAQAESDGYAVANFGTGAFILSETTQEVSPNRLLKSVSYSTAEQCHWVLEGTINGAGAALDWLAVQWESACVGQLASQLQFYDELEVWLATEREPALFINTVGGLGSPWWAGECTPYFTLPHRETTRAAKSTALQWSEKAVAVLESIAFMATANLQAMVSVRQAPINVIYCSGGVCKVAGFSQLLADATGIRVIRLAQTETTLMGVALMAIHSDAPNKVWPVAQQVFEPRVNGALQSRKTQLLTKLSLL